MLPYSPIIHYIGLYNNLINNTSENCMSMHTYGVNTLNSGYVDVSNTLLGAKQYATRNGYNEVYVRYNNGYHINKVATKTNGKRGKAWYDSKHTKTSV